MNIIIQTYNEKNEGRQVELRFCMQKLLENDNVKRVIDLSESKEPLKMYGDCVENEKYKFVGGNKWITYRDAIKYGLDNIERGEVVALINNDIFISSQKEWVQVGYYLDSFKKASGKTSVILQTRHEWNGSEETSKRDKTLDSIYGCYSQDMWIWRNGELTDDKEYEIRIGVMGCDNAIAHRMFMNGILPYNLGNQLRIYHFDVCRNKTIDNAKDFHFYNEKQKSEGHEVKGALTVPYLSLVPHIINTMGFCRRHKDSLNKIKSFARKYDIFLRINMDAIKIDNTV